MLKQSKPYILSIDTAGKTCSVCIALGDEIIAEVIHFNGNEHDRLLAEYIKVCLLSANISIERLDVVAISSGPGSFTGLRIGAAIAKGLCFGGKPKLIGVPSLDAFAFNASMRNTNKYDIISIIQSHKDLAYYQIFDSEANSKSEIFIEDITVLNSMVFSEKIICGSGANLISNKSQNTITHTNDAKIIADLAYKMYENEQFSDVNDFNPMYIQEFKPKTSTKKLSI